MRGALWNTFNMTQGMGGMTDHPMAADDPIKADNPIKVVQIIAGFAVEKLGGVERYGIELARNLAQHSVQSTICALWDWGTPEEAIWRDRLAREGIATVVAAPKDDASPYKNYVDVVRGMQAAIAAPVDILHSHSEFGDLAAIWLKRALGARLLVRTVHNEREWSKRPLRRLLITNGICPLWFDGELGVSQQVVGNLNQRPLARLLGRRAVVMYNSLDFSRFDHPPISKSAKRAELGIAADAPVLGAVGRLAPQKGFDILLRAVPLVLAQRPDARFLIAGEGEMKEALQAAAAQLGIEHAVRLLGRRTDVEELLQIFDLFVSSSRWEGLPTVLLESIAAGVPVVATRVSGTVELVQDQVNGLLVPPEDPEALASAILRGLAERERLVDGVLATRPQIKEQFSFAGIAAKQAALYRNLLTTKTR